MTGYPFLPVDAILFGMALGTLVILATPTRGLCRTTLTLLAISALLFAEEDWPAPASLTASVLGLAGISHFWEMRRALSSYSD